MSEFDLNKSEQYTLSIRLSADGFSFSIHHPSKEDERVYMTYQVNASYSMTANIKEMMASEEMLKQHFKQVNILVESPRFTFVPFELYDDDQAETLFHYNLPKINNETILCNILGKSNTALLFGMDKHAHQLLCESFPNARFFSCTSPLIEHFTVKSREGNNRKLYAHFKKSRLEVYALDRGKLLLANVFNCRHTADQVYYLLYVWQQLGYNQQKDELWLANVPSREEELLTELHKFLKQVNTLPDVDPALPFDLQTLMTCE